MKGQKVLPSVFLLILFIIIVFIVGVRYGKRVEQANKTISYLLTVTPYPSTTPYQLRYLTYSNKECGIMVLYPSFLTVTGESSHSATLKQNSSTVLQISCEKTSDISKILADPKVATTEVTFKNHKVQGKKQGELVYFKTLNPSTGTPVYISVNPNLLPLVDNTFQFTP